MLFFFVIKKEKTNRIITNIFNSTLGIFHHLFTPITFSCWINILIFGIMNPNRISTMCQCTTILSILEWFTPVLWTNGAFFLICASQINWQSFLKQNKNKKTISSIEKTTHTDQIRDKNSFHHYATNLKIKSKE